MYVCVHIILYLKKNLSFYENVQASFKTGGKGLDQRNRALSNDRSVQYLHCSHSSHLLQADTEQLQFS